MKNALESIFWGIIAALGALVVELIFFIGFSIYVNPIAEISLSQFFVIPQYILIAVCIEEIFKYIIIAKQIDQFSLEKSYIINSFFVGLGFLGVELALIFISNGFPPIQSLLEIAIIHIGTTGLIGYFVATGNPKKITTFLLAMFFAIAFHASYNLLLLKREPLQNYIVFVILGLLILLNIWNFFRISRKLAQE